MKILIMTDMEGVAGVLNHREAEHLTTGVVTVSGKRGQLPDDLEELDTESYRKAQLSAVHGSPKLVRTLIRNGAQASLQKRRQNPEAFRYPALAPEFTRRIRFRKNGGTPAYETVDRHPTSIIDLMNMPIASGPGMAAHAGSGKSRAT